jgi:cytochrome c-type biogenesis protein CcmH
MRAIGLGVLLVALFASPAARSASPPDPTDIAHSLMSPVCPGRLIADCPSPESEQLRELIRQLIAQGKTKEEIIAYFVEVYGRQVLPAPPQRGFFLTAWYLPLAGILSGGGVIYLLLRIWSRRGQEVPLAPEDPVDRRYTEILDRELKEFDT